MPNMNNFHTLRRQAQYALKQAQMARTKPEFDRHYAEYKQLIYRIERLFKETA